ncbi:MAG: hypothetical protein JWN86_828 [Planctomycetota bacterium]|nr:hypothetical protein [Planctomycetota bacterium]
MPVMILPADHLRQIIRRRHRLGIDHRDEVWDGVYVVSPEADNEHQQIGRKLANAIESALGDEERTQVFHGANVSDRSDDWRKNFRIPDVAVFLPENRAEDRGTHWFGGPDFAVEVMSRGDRSRKKFDFYTAVHVRELLLVNRRKWRLELYRCDGKDWPLVATVGLEESPALPSASLGLSFRLLPGPKRPQIEVRRADGQTRWLA